MVELYIRRAEHEVDKHYDVFSLSSCSYQKISFDGGVGSLIVNSLDGKRISTKPKKLPNASILYTK